MRVRCEKPYLIQRARFKGVPLQDIVGMDSLFHFDYMGSAEFEFGALPKSLRTIVENHADYEMFTVNEVKNLNGETMQLYCHKDVFERAKENATHLSNEPYGYKEYCDMPHYLGKREGYEVGNDFWWDISNHYMICFGEDHAIKLLTALEKMAEKWAVKRQ